VHEPLQHWPESLQTSNEFTQQRSSPGNTSVQVRPVQHGANVGPQASPGSVAQHSPLGKHS